MGLPSTHNVVLLIILLGGVLTMKIDTVFAQGPSKPEGDSTCWYMASFAAYCMSFMQGNSTKFHVPSKKCCTYAQKTNIVQFCKRFVLENERVYNAAKVVEVARYCRNPLPSGTKCGNHTVP
ncbi:hypothetical protein ABFS82_03G024000 [Erythranthe guttata]|uniref:uncharacterized protein LOC105966835 n=1 Tax=Erythranthe guttata TaxID=4155 RepID=UPI00064DE6DC|nr:PREDICTED: uncharacterized protein LOC105966835 [Erythranthe guttata]|eukprot:XP_012846869.1 PREDICTED: uncharacterized protein LOC105966835 [Erythranthe guttata]